jgi:hypothetical protein
MRAIATLAAVFLCLAAGPILSAPLQTPSVKPVPVSREILMAYVGAYLVEGGEVVRILLEGDNLIGMDQLGTKVLLAAKSETAFAITSNGGEIRFFKDGQGDITHLVITGAGTQRLPRIVVAPDVLEKYVGSYPLPSGITFVITLEGSRLMVQGEGRSKYPMFPDSPTSFFIQDPGNGDLAQLEFGRDPDGRASYLVVRQDGFEEKAARK